ncbi:PLP-dependent transferase [Aspergillus alliaceus]|uniref:aspartate transaminase n=1 Tax=Petromyces alliaceus TaxID=209559 RepID=A0A5N7CL37_PETAA|nr:PLP-dependent transferase [Aspergillus alliaceus]
MSSSRFHSLDILPVGETHALKAAFHADDKSPNKVFLGTGAYRDHRGQPWILPAVKKAKQRLALDSSENHEYLPISGDPSFIRHAQRLIFGDFEREDPNPINSRQVVSLQTVSGTGANHIGARFLVETIRPRAVWISNPSWINHSSIWKMLQPLMFDEDRRLEIQYYPYYVQASHSLEFEETMRVLDAKANTDDVLVLQPCAHNPTGLDFTHDQWTAIAELCVRKKVLPFFDAAYQGFATGSLNKDIWAVRHFYGYRMELCVAQSFSKNMGLYSERTGAFHLVTFSKDAATQSLRKLVQIQRGETSSPPAFGAKIAKTILGDPALHKIWQHNIQEMTLRLREMRAALFNELVRLGTPGSWNHLLKSVGMFSCTGLNPEQVSQLRAQYHIYILNSGRISLAGLNEENVSYVARAIDTVVRAKTRENEINLA